MKNLSKFLFLILFTSYCSLLTHEVNALGTTANTQILNTARSVTLNFSNETGTGTVTRNSYNSVTSSVQAVYGISGTFSGGQIAQTTGAGQEIAFTAHSITNISNTAVTINANNGNFSISYLPNAGDSADWQARFSGTNLNIVNRWVTSNMRLPNNLWASGVVQYNNFVYVIGGATTSPATATTSVFISQMNSDGSLTAWTKSPKELPSPLFTLSAVTYKNRIYVLGGKNQSNSLQSSSYAATINANGTLTDWVAISSLPESISQATAVTHGDYVYLAGGEGGDYLDTVYRGRFLPNGDISWNATPAHMSTQRWFPSMAVYNKRLYVSGGRDALGTYLSSIEVSAINTDGSLTAFSNANSSGLPLMGNHTAMVYNNQLILIGGNQGGNASASIWKSTIASNGVLGTWTQFSSLSQKRQYHKSLFHNGRLYTFGGTNGNNTNTDATSINYVGTLISVRSANNPADQNQSFNFFTTPDIYALNSSQGLVSTNYFLGYEIPATQIGAYTGFNNNSYGGSNRVSALTTTTVSGPDIVYVSRTKTIQAPPQYITNGGGASDPVPGALIHYQVVIKNQGNASAATVNVYEKIKHSPIAGPLDAIVSLYYGSSLTPNVTVSSPTNTTVTYSNDDGATYNHPLNPGKIDNSARDIRWTIPTMPVGGTATMNYSVVINET